MACCLRNYQMALRSVLTIPLDMSRGRNYSHEGWVSLQPHDGHTALSVFSSNKCWMIYLRLIPRCKQTTCTVLPSPWGLPLRSAYSLSLSRCPPSESSKSESALLSHAARFAKQKTLFCVMVSKLHPLVLMIIFLLTEDDYWSTDEIYSQRKTDVLTGVFVFVFVFFNSSKWVCDDLRFSPSVTFCPCSVSVLVPNYSYHKDKRAQSWNLQAKYAVKDIEEILFFNLLLFCSPPFLFSSSCFCFVYIFLIYSCSLLFPFLAIHY